MSSISYDKLISESILKKQIKQDLYEASYIIPSIARILEKNWKDHAKDSPNNFADIISTYISDPTSLSNPPNSLDNINAFNKDVGCDINKPNSLATKITINSFKKTLAREDEGIKDLIEICKLYAFNHEDATIYCSQDFINNINDYFLDLAGSCNV